jgi:hypothetical protein
MNTEQTPVGYVTTGLVALCLLCTMTNVLAFMSLGPPPRPVGASPTPLPRPNQFIGLEKVNRTRPGVRPASPLWTRPRSLSQVNLDQPTEHMPHLTRWFFSSYGAISTNQACLSINRSVSAYARLVVALIEELILVQVSTVAQFRARDYGMTDCQLVVSLPEIQDQERATNRSLAMRPANVTIDVWTLDAKVSLDPTQISAASRPPRSHLLLSRVEVGLGSELKSPSFYCPTDSLQTFEVACSDDCHLKFWQDELAPSSGE